MELRPLIWGKMSPAIERVIRGEGYSSDKDLSYAELYVNCNPCSSWERFARSLYHHHQVAAVEEVRSYLPPRGEPENSVLLKFWSEDTLSVCM